MYKDKFSTLYGTYKHKFNLLYGTYEIEFFYCTVRKNTGFSTVHPGKNQVNSYCTVGKK